MMNTVVRVNTSLQMGQSIKGTSQIICELCNNHCCVVGVVRYNFIFQDDGTKRIY